MKINKGGWLLLSVLIFIMLQIHAVNNIPLGPGEYFSVTLSNWSRCETPPFTGKHEFSKQNNNYTPVSYRIKNSIMMIPVLITSSFINPVLPFFMIIIPLFYKYSSLSTLYLPLLLIIISFIYRPEKFNPVYSMASIFWIAFTGYFFIPQLPLAGTGFLTKTFNYLAHELNITAIILLLLPLIYFIHEYIFENRKIDIPLDSLHLFIAAIILKFNPVLLSLSLIFLISEILLKLTGKIRYILIFLYILVFIFSFNSLTMSTPWDPRDIDFKIISDKINTLPQKLIFTKQWSCSIFTYLTGKKTDGFEKLTEDNMPEILSRINLLKKKDDFIFLFHLDDDGEPPVTSEFIKTELDKTHQSELFFEHGLFRIYIYRRGQR